MKLVGRDGSTISTMTDAHPIEVDGDTAIVFIYGPTCVVESRFMSATVPSMGTSRRTIFEAALEVHPDIVLIHDDEHILFANAACRRFLAAETPQDLEGRPIDVIIHPDAYAAGRERRRLILDCARALRDVPLKLIGLDGQTRHVVVDAHPLVVGGEVQGAMVVAHPGSL